MALVVILSALLPTAVLATEQKTQASDQQFINKAYSINEGEIELGRLAQSRGTTPQVRELGQRMVGDHTVALEQLRDVARKDNLTLPDKLQPEQVDLYKRLAKLEGTKFDEAYIEHMRSGHKSAIRAFQQECDHGQSADARDYAEKELPMLKSHEAIAKSDRHRM